MSRKIICDRCGAEITSRPKLGYIALNYRDPKSGDLLDNNILEESDFCETCMHEITEYIGQKPDLRTRPKAKTVVTKPAPKVDTGKIMALHKAGWSNQQIAEEMKISSQLVSSHLKKMLEEKDA